MNEFVLDISPRSNMSSNPASTQSPDVKDHWDSETYSKKVAPYVPALTTRIVGMLDPKEDGE